MSNLPTAFLDRRISCTPAASLQAVAGGPLPPSPPARERSLTFDYSNMNPNLPGNHARGPPPMVSEFADAPMPRPVPPPAANGGPDLDPAENSYNRIGMYDAATIPDNLSEMVTPSRPAQWSTNLVTGPGRLFSWAAKASPSLAQTAGFAFQNHEPLRSVPITPPSTENVRPYGPKLATSAPPSCHPSPPSSASPDPVEMAEMAALSPRALSPPPSEVSSRSTTTPSTPLSASSLALYPGTAAPRPSSGIASLKALAETIKTSAPPRRPLAPANHQSAASAGQKASGPRSHRSSSASVAVGTLISRTIDNNDQQASLTLQQRLKTSVGAEFAKIESEIVAQARPLMTSRFGNFVVQGMLDRAGPETTTRLGEIINGAVFTLATNPFACHVLQKLLDVGSQAVRAQILVEMLGRTHETLTNASGTHVWQKLLHMSLPAHLPSVVQLVSEALDVTGAGKHTDFSGWIPVVVTEPGCAAVRSLLSADHLPGVSDVLECIFDSLAVLVTRPTTHSLVLRLAQNTASYRERVLGNVLTHAKAYIQDPVASTLIVDLLALRIPGFANRLRARVGSLADIPGPAQQVAAALSGRRSS